MKYMKFLIAAAILILIWVCGQTINGPILTEKAEVIETCYIPKGHGSDVAVGYNFGKNGGTTITPINIDIPERYAVVFKCKHGKFAIDGERGMALYNKLEKGDKVVITYCETFWATGTETNITGLHFIDARKEKK
jgi:hypothetical protein